MVPYAIEDAFEEIDTALHELERAMKLKRQHDLWVDEAVTECLTALRNGLVEIADYHREWQEDGDK